MLIEFYANLFTSSNLRILERILEGVQPVVTEDMRNSLARPFTVEEVEGTIKDMAFKGLRIGWDASLILPDLLDWCRYGYLSCYSIVLKF